MPKQHYFLCHSESDADAALQLSKDLSERGLRSWIEAFDVRPGVQTKGELENAIEAASADNTKLPPFLRELENVDLRQQADVKSGLDRLV